MNPDKITAKVNGIDILSMDSLEDFTKNNKVDIAMLTVPNRYVTEVAERVTSIGIKGFGTSLA